MNLLIGIRDVLARRRASRHDLQPLQAQDPAATASAALNSPSPPALIRVFGIPHRATSAAFDHISAIVMSAGSNGLRCELVTGAAYSGSTLEVREMYLRPDALDVLPLAAAADVGRWADRRRRHSAVARLDAGWRHLPTLSLESAIEDEVRALAFLVETFDLTFDKKAVQGTRSSFKDLKCRPHDIGDPLGFLASVQTFEAAAKSGGAKPAPPPSRARDGDLSPLGLTWRARQDDDPSLAPDHLTAQLADIVSKAITSTDVSRMLLVSLDADAVLDRLGPHVPPSVTLVGLSLETAPQRSEEICTPYGGDDRPGFWRQSLGGDPGRTVVGDMLFDLIHLHDLQAYEPISDLLSNLLIALAPKGRLSGLEHSPAALHAVVLRMTGAATDAGLVLSLGSTRWTARVNPGAAN